MAGVVNMSFELSFKGFGFFYAPRLSHGFQAQGRHLRPGEHLSSASQGQPGKVDVAPKIGQAQGQAE